MPQYEYIAINNLGKRIKEKQNALSEDNLYNELLIKNMFPIKITEVKKEESFLNAY